MSRMIQLFAVFAVSSALAGATIAACGARPGSASEMPPVAPRPASIDPSGAPAPGGPGSARIQRMPVPEVGGAAYAINEDAASAGVVGSQVPRDAGVTPDGYSPPMQPLPDGGVSDSRLEQR